MIQYVIPKDRQSVTLRFKNARFVNGTIFLERLPQTRSLHERITDFLEQPNRFFPFLEDGAATAVFISKITVWALETVQTETTEADSVELSLMHIQNITVRMLDGTTITGALMAETRPEESRLSDCLNLKEMFMSLKVDGRLLYVNKDRTRVVEASRGQE
ncbi:MAG: hypothetical protein A3J24_06650 [Deltaproteobacteria bacterium RIFCSPLOWO2_02_FULL_53_8]|nr:MAG: hypothetical protein A3J24_06650 [Deltaproteobacteria bacterium RIFCSPLOWO2_02_FULL_53_8]